MVGWLIRTGLAAVMLLCFAPPVVAQQPMVPGGSYLDTCKNVRFDPATNRLDADCEATPRGTWEGEAVRSGDPFYVTDCLPNSIFNANGDLYCYTSKPWGKGRVVPQGSYLASCAHSRVVNNVLMARCDDSSDEAHSADLNLNECSWGGDISNNHGSLTCEETVAEGAPALVKPVAVEPGVVKPVSIAPLAPPTGGATEATSPADPKKREGKRRRDRGERG
jgi:hypothetical protein